MHVFNFSHLQPYLFCVSGIIFIVISLFKKSKTEDLGIRSELAEGTIHELQGNKNIRRNSGEVNSITEDKIVVEFVTKHKEWVTAPLKNLPGMHNPHQYKIGDKVNIIYNPYNPTDFIIQAKRSERNARIFIAIVGVLFLMIAILEILVQ